MVYQARIDEVYEELMSPNKKVRTRKTQTRKMIDEMFKESEMARKFPLKKAS